MSRIISAVEFIWGKRPIVMDETRKVHDDFEKAFELFKGQIKAAYNQGYRDGQVDKIDSLDIDIQYFEDAERYFKKTYQP
jgi:hypothetical protein